jgi:hypothetical protein
MRRRVAAASVGLLAAGCSGLMGASTTPVAEPAPVVPQSISQEVIGQTPWPVKTRYVVDLWLHGYAMLETDSIGVPDFRRDYRDAMVVEKNSRNITTRLDDNTDALRRGLRQNPELILGQELVLKEQSWEEMGNDIAAFLTASTATAGGSKDGRPSILSTWKRTKGASAETTDMMTALGRIYRTESDRAWLKLFALSLTDEHSKFYEQYWRDQQRTMRPVLAAVDSQFSQHYLKFFRSYLRGVQLPTGEILLSLPLDGEGRTFLAGQHSIAIGFPVSADSSLEAVYSFAHEAAGVLAEEAVQEGTTVAEQRSGVAGRYVSPAEVRGGAMLLQRAIPELVPGYQRHYLSAARVPMSDAAVDTVFVRAFPLKQSMIDAMDRKLDSAMRGS